MTNWRSLGVLLAFCVCLGTAQVSNGYDMYKTGVYYALTVSPTDNDVGVAATSLTASLCSYDRPTLATSVEFLPMRESLPVTNHNSSLVTLDELTGAIEVTLGDDLANSSILTATDGGLYIGLNDLSLADHFGFTVAISDYWLFTTSLLENGSPGAIYVYFRAFDRYNFYQKIEAAGGLVGAFSDFDPISDANANPWNFINKPGFTRIHVDREHFFIGDANGLDALSRSTGSLDIYTRQDSTNDLVHNPLWELTQTIYGDPPTDSGDDTAFGAYFDAYGNFLLVGAAEQPYVDQNDTEIINSGAVYVYRKNALTARWERTQKLTSPEGFPFRNDTFLGESFETPRIFTNRVAIGARTFGNDTTGYCSGRVYLYDLNRQTSELDYSDVYLSLYDSDTINNTESTEFSFFGYAIDMDQRWLIVGAPGEVRDGANTTEIEQRGQVLIYDWTGYTYDFYQHLEGSLGHTGDNFGQSISCDNGLCLISAPRTFIPGSGSQLQGVTYTFEFDGLDWIETKITMHNNSRSVISLGSSQIADVHWPWMVIGGMTQANPLDSDEQGAGFAIACPARPILHYTPGPAPGSDFFCYNTTSDAFPGESFEGEIYVEIYMSETQAETNAPALQSDLINALLSSSTNTALCRTLQILTFIFAGLAVLMIVIGLFNIATFRQYVRDATSYSRSRRR